MGPATSRRELQRRNSAHEGLAVEPSGFYRRAAHAASANRSRSKLPFTESAACPHRAKSRRCILYAGWFRPSSERGCDFIECNCLRWSDSTEGKRPSGCPRSFHSQAPDWRTSHFHAVVASGESELLIAPYSTTLILKNRCGGVRVVLVKERLVPEAVLVCSGSHWAALRSSL